MAGFFSDNFLERVRAASDIVEVIGAILPLKRAGGGFVGLCPFHKEKSPSFHVNAHRQIFHCFGCHKGGDVFKFIQDYENVTFPEAMRRLADRAKIPLEYERGGPDTQGHFLKESLLQMHEQITQRWQNALSNEASGQLAREYLAKRGVSEEAVKLFRIGSAPESWDDTVNWAKGKSYDLALVERAGLIIRKEGTDRYYDRFRGRLMFPICDEQGRVIGFSGRVLSGDEKTAKYVNSPESPIFVKSKVFFGLDKSKRAILDAGHAIICEGQLDLIACYMAGVQNVVAPQGTAFTADHARILRRYVEEAVLCFDSDVAGQNAAVRSLDHMLGAGIAVRVAVMPPPHDPDSFIKENGGEAFRAMIQKAEGFFDYYLKRLCDAEDIATDRGRLAVLRNMSEALHKTGNQVLIDAYAQKTAMQLGVEPRAVRAEFAKVTRKQPVERESREEEMPVEPEEEVAPPSQLEHWLLRLMFINDDLVPWAASRLDPRWIQHAAVQQAVSRRIELHTAGTWSSLPAFLTSVESPEVASLVTEVIAESRPIPNQEQQVKDIVLRLRNQFIDQQMTLLRSKANHPETPEQEALEILRKQQELRDLKRTPVE